MQICLLSLSPQKEAEFWKAHNNCNHHENGYNMIRPCARLLSISNLMNGCYYPAFTAQTCQVSGAQRNTDRRPSWASRTHVLASIIQQDHVHSYILSFFFFFLAIAMKMEIVRPMESLTSIQFSTIIFPIPVTSTAQILSVWTPCLWWGQWDQDALWHSPSSPNPSSLSSSKLFIDWRKQKRRIKTHSGTIL